MGGGEPGLDGIGRGLIMAALEQGWIWDQHEGVREELIEELMVRGED